MAIAVEQEQFFPLRAETAHDPLVRMALVPRVLEARGLDVTPAMVQRLKSIGDTDAVDILDIIARDEVGHVAVGTEWFNRLCESRGYEPEATFRALALTYLPRLPKGPFHTQARLEAGFSESELEWLEAAEQCAV